MLIKLRHKNATHNAMLHSCAIKGQPIRRVKQLQENEELFNSIEEHFKNAGATSLENAPNWSKIPERKERTTSNDPKQIETGNYSPRNMSQKPLDLSNFTAAPTSLDKK